jgi:hypothetical protein
MSKDETTPGMRRRYRIVVRGRLSERFASGFGGVTVEPGPVETALVGDFQQEELHGTFDRLRDFGLELLRVEEVP